MAIDEPLIDGLAQAIHERYVAEQVHDGVAMGAGAAMVSWQDLSEDLKETNRDQARDIGAKLAAIGCSVGPAGKEPFTFTDDEIERLARAEHQRWSRQRRSAGWSYGPVRDDAARRHPSLVPWARLPERERDKDRDTVRNIPAVLAAAGLSAIRQP